MSFYFSCCMPKFLQFYWLALFYAIYDCALAARFHSILWTNFLCNLILILLFLSFGQVPNFLAFLFSFPSISTRSFFSNKLWFYLVVLRAKYDYMCFYVIFVHSTSGQLEPIFVASGFTLLLLLCFCFGSNLHQFLCFISADRLFRYCNFSSCWCCWIVSCAM